MLAVSQVGSSHMVLAGLHQTSSYIVANSRLKGRRAKPLEKRKEITNREVLKISLYFRKASGPE